MSIYDPRIKKQAEILVDYSLKVKKGEKVLVIGDFKAKPLMLEIYKTLSKKEVSDVKLRYDSYEYAEIYYKYATNEQLNYFPTIDFTEMKYFDCYLRIASSINTRGLANIDANKISLRSKILKPISDYRVEKMRWCITRFPTDAQAQEADM